MANCDVIHKEYDRLANGEVQVGELPPWMSIKGKVAWYVYRGPYGGLGEAWGTFSEKVHAAKLEHGGPPGDVYVCDPKDHEADEHTKLLTILWSPMEE